MDAALPVLLHRLLSHTKIPPAVAEIYEANPAPLLKSDDTVGVGARVLQRRAGEASKAHIGRAWSVPAYLVALALASTVPIAIVAGVFGFHFVTESSERTRADFAERLQLMRSAVELRIENIVNDIEVLALSPALQSGDLALFYQHAAEVRRLRNAFGLVLSDRQGQQIINTRQPFGTVLPHRSATEAQELVFKTGRPQVSDLIYTTTDRQPIISIEVPVRIGGDIRYVLAIGLSPNYLSALMDAYVPPDYVGSISDRKGILIARRPLQSGLDLVGKPTIPEVLAHIGENAAFWIEATSRTGVPTYTSLLRSDLTLLVDHALAGTLDRVEAEWDRRSALTVVLAAAGYPDKPRRGDVIEGLDRVTPQAYPDVTVFHAGTAADGSRIRVNGGRVLGVTALGDTLRQAQRAAYAAVGGLRFDGMQYRTDIGHRALARRS